MRYRTLSSERIVRITRIALHTANIPERYWNVSLQQIIDAKHKRQLIHYLLSVKQRVETGQGLYLYGNHETGKTSAGIALLKEVIRRGGTVYFICARRILDAIYDSEETPDGLDLVRNRLRDVDMLMLDDLGAEGFDPKKGGGAVLEGIFRDRYDQRLPIIVTSQYAPTNLMKTYTEAIVNIIRRTVTILKVQTEQWKGKK